MLAVHTAKPNRRAVVERVEFLLLVVPRPKRRRTVRQKMPVHDVGDDVGSVLTGRSEVKDAGKRLFERGLKRLKHKGEALAKTAATQKEELAFLRRRQGVFDAALSFVQLVGQVATGP